MADGSGRKWKVFGVPSSRSQTDYFDVDSIKQTFPSGRKTH
jgi:hypothetical protein